MPDEFRLDEIKHHLGGDRGVDGAAAVAQYLAAGFRGKRIRGGNHVALVVRGCGGRLLRGRGAGEGTAGDQQRGKERSHLAGRALAIGGANCRSMSQGKRIQVSWLTSVMKVSTSGRPAGLA